MKRTTLTITDELAALLEYEQRRRAVPASVIVRDALDGYFAAQSKPLAIVGLGRSGSKHTACDMEAALDREWTFERFMGRSDPGPVQATKTGDNDDSISTGLPSDAPPTGAP